MSSTPRPLGALWAWFHRPPDPTPPHILLAPGLPPHQGIEALVAAGFDGALTLPFGPELSPGEIPHLGALWPGPLTLELPLSSLDERLSALPLEGVNIRVTLPHCPGEIPSVEAHLEALRALQRAAAHRRAGDLEFGAILDPRAFLLLPRLILKLGRFRPARFLIERSPGPVDGSTQEALRAAAEEVRALGKALVVRGAPCEGTPAMAAPRRVLILLKGAAFFVWEGGGLRAGLTPLADGVAPRQGVEVGGPGAPPPLFLGALSLPDGG